MWQNLFGNPHNLLIKKYLYELLKDKYIENEKFIDRMSNQLSYKEDADQFIKLIKDAFGCGFNLAIDQQKEQFSKLGIKLNIVDENFNNSNKKNKIF